MAAIYLTAGPSGAGKDTLLLCAREALAAVQDTTVLFVRRHLTRDPSKVTDIEVAVTPEQFAAASAAGEYALEWDAHGTRYAIAKADLEAGIVAGKRMVLNTSRSVVGKVSCSSSYRRSPVIEGRACLRWKGAYLRQKLNLAPLW